MNNKLSRRNPIIIFWIICFFFLFFITLFAKYQLFTDSNYTSLKTNLNFIKRGNIYIKDKLGNKVLVARSVYQKNLIINPQLIKDRASFINSLKTIIPIEEENYKDITGETNLVYKILFKDLTGLQQKEIIEHIQKNDIDGVYFEKIISRFYPYKELASAVIGFISFDKDSNYKGNYGIEKSFNNELESGASVVLSLDYNLQTALRQILTKAQDDLFAKEIGGLVVDPNTGKLLASVSLPGFNLNKFDEITDLNLFRNNNIENVYEFGSVFKPITLAIGLESKKVDIGDTYNDRGFVKIGGHTISNYDKRGRGENTSIKDIIVKSLNTGSVFILLKTGIETYSNYLSAFKLSEKTNIKLPNEVNNLVGNLEKGREINYATASYGHGIAITPISAVKLFSSLANGGNIINPFIVDSLILRGGEVFPYEQPKINPKKIIFSETTLNNVTNILVEAYDKYLLGGSFKKNRFTIATKTGTAVLLNTETGEYFEDRLLFSMFGYFPASKPKYLVFLYVVDPVGKSFASEGLGPYFSIFFDYINNNYLLEIDR